MNTKSFLVFFSIITIIGFTPIVFAGGSGSEESDVLFINQNYFKVQLETSPSILTGDETQINFDSLIFFQKSYRILYLFH